MTTSNMVTPQKQSEPQQSHGLTTLEPPTTSPNDAKFVREAPRCVYRLCKQIGKGRAIVYRGTVTASNITAAPRGSQVAIKVYDTHGWTREKHKFVEKEIEILSKLRHPNIVQYYSTSYNEGKRIAQRNRPSYFSRSRLPNPMFAQSNIAIVQELCSRKDLFYNIAKHGPMNTKLATYYSRELFQAVMYLHSQRVSHRDIKLENLVFDHHWTLKICDFGHAMTWDMCVDVPSTSEGAGTKSYRSPELHSNIMKLGFNSAKKTVESDKKTTVTEEPKEKYDPRSADSWACAVVYFELLLGYPPMICADATNDWYFNKIVSNNWSAFWAQHENMCVQNGNEFGLQKMTPVMKDFFQKAFHHDFNERASAAELIAHEFLSCGGDTENHLTKDQLKLIMEKRI